MRSQRHQDPASAFCSTRSGRWSKGAKSTTPQHRNSSCPSSLHSRGPVGSLAAAMRPSSSLSGPSRSQETSPAGRAARQDGPALAYAAPAPATPPAALLTPWRAASHLARAQGPARAARARAGCFPMPAARPARWPLTRTLGGSVLSGCPVSTASSFLPVTLEVEPCAVLRVNRPAPSQETGCSELAAA
jgi:hypothetical protein